MIEIKFINEMIGEELVEELEKKYDSIDKLERAFQRDDENMKLHMDLEDWKYFLKHPKEEVKQTKIVFTEKSNINMIELEIMSYIKNKKPKSITELAKLLNKDVSSVQRKVTKLEQEGFVDLKDGSKNSKVPKLHYDKIEIAI